MGGEIHIHIIYIHIYMDRHIAFPAKVKRKGKQSVKKGKAPEAACLGLRGAAMRESARCVSAATSQWVE